MFGGGRKKKGGADDAKQHQSQVSMNSDLFDLSQLRSLAGMPQSGVDEDDSALEAELVALMADDGSVGPSRSTARTRVRPSQIDNLDIEVKEGKEDEVTEEDLDNPDYLAELAMLSEDDANMETLRPSPRPSPRASPKPSPQPSPRSSPAPQRKTESDVKVLVQERLEMYQLALKNAEAANEGSKARRYGRGIKTLKGLEKKLKQGAKIDESEIPPMVATGGQHKPLQEPEKAPPPPASEAVQPSRSNNVSVPGDPSTKGVRESEMALLKKRQHEYKMAALEAKRAGDRETAAEHLRVAKQFDSVISAIEQGEEVDLSGMPPPPSSALQGASALVPPPKQQKIQAPVIDVVAPGGQSEATASDAEPSMPSTPLEALQQRHDTYKALLDKATTEGNASKCRRLGRIVKNYQEAIKKERAGKPVDYEELATLPGFSPIPPRGSISKSQGQPSPGQPSPGQPSPGQPSPGQPSPGQPSGASSQPATAAASARPALTRPPSVKEAQNLKNLRILTQRQKQYKTLALQAKKEGDMGEAMRLLKLAKGFDSMITASENGLPVNMESIPPSPTQQQFSVEDERERMICDPPAGEELSAEVLADSKQLYARLMATLNKQIQICATNEKQYMQLGNLSTSKRFGEMKHSCQQDLDVLTVSMSHSDPVPRFHYETRTIPSIRVCPDLTDTEVEVSIIKGIQLKLPSGEKDLDTYIKFEFPYPNDEPQTGKTGWSKGFEMVEYNDSTKLNIQRNRSFASCVKRRSIRFEVYYGRGFLRSDKLLAQASLKLADLESKCEIHESVPLYDGRKPTGGKLEVKVRVHHPVSGVKEDQIKEKWLVINSTHKKSSHVPTSSSSLSSPSKQPTPHGNTAANPSQKNVQPADSLAVLNWELETLKKKLAEFQAQRRSIPKELNEQQKILSDRMHKLQLFLKEGGKQARQAYVARLQASLSSYFALAKQSLQAGNKEKAGVLMAKRKLVESEIASLTK